MAQQLSFDGDVVIVGGGLAGQTLALALHSAGVSVAVVDVLPFSTQLDDRFDGRASALAYTSMRMLDTLGAGARLREFTQRIEDIVVCDGRPDDGLRPGGPGPHSLHFDRHEIHPGADGEPLGWMAENRHARLAMTEAIAARSDISVFAPARAVDWVRSPAFTDVRLDDGRLLRGRLLVACDGKFSSIRRREGTRTFGWGYGQKGIVATVEHDEPHNGVAYEYFMPSGPFAILPLSGNRSSLVWTEKAAAADALKAMDADGFHEALRARFGNFLGEVRETGPRWTYPLTLNVAERFHADGIAYCGDAARGIHPLAGQGFNLGIRDAAALAEIVAKQKRLGLDLGSTIGLKRYESWRRLDSIALVGATDLFNRLFSNDIAPLRMARGLGLALVDRIPPARRFFMRHAGGEIGDLPKLLRGESLAA